MLETHRHSRPQRLMVQAMRRQLATALWLEKMREIRWLLRLSGMDH